MRRCRPPGRASLPRLAPRTRCCSRSSPGSASRRRTRARQVSLNRTGFQGWTSKSQWRRVGAESTAWSSSASRSHAAWSPVCRWLPRDGQRHQREPAVRLAPPASGISCPGRTDTRAFADRRASAGIHRGRRARDSLRSASTSGAIHCLQFAAVGAPPESWRGGSGGVRSADPGFRRAQLLLNCLEHE